MTELLIYFLIYLAINLLLLMVVRFTWPQWGIVRSSLLAAAPLPTMLIAACMLVVAQAANTSKADCGVDACGMAMGLSTIASFYAFVGFAVIWVLDVAILAFLHGKRPTRC